MLQVSGLHGWNFWNMKPLEAHFATSLFAELPTGNVRGVHLYTWAVLNHQHSNLMSDILIVKNTKSILYDKKRDKLLKIC